MRRSAGGRSSVTRRWRRSDSRPWKSNDLESVTAPRATRAHGVDDAGLVGEDHGLYAVPDLELGQDPGDVGLDRRLSDDDLRGDLGVGAAADQQPEHCAFSLGELGQPRRRRAARSPVGELLDHPLNVVSTITRTALEAVSRRVASRPSHVRLIAG